MSTFTIGHYEDLRGKRVLVTGGSAGIGKAIALAYHQNGAVVTVLGRRLERLEAVIKEMDGKGYAVTADLSNNEKSADAVKEAIEKMGGIDILINNGGVFSPEMAGNSPAALMAGQRLHVESAYTLFLAAEEELVKNKGAVVNVSSIAAFVPQKNMVSYSVAKASQDALTRNLAFKYSDKGVRINAIQPAAIKTEAFESMAKGAGISLDEQMKAFNPMHAFGRTGVPEEIAAPTLFLTSKAASFITGQILAVDGGVSLTSWGNHPSFTDAIKPPNQ